MPKIIYIIYVNNHIISKKWLFISLFTIIKYFIHFCLTVLVRNSTKILNRSSGGGVVFYLVFDFTEIASNTLPFENITCYLLRLFLLSLSFFLRLRFFPLRSWRSPSAFLLCNTDSAMVWIYFIKATDPTYFFVLSFWVEKHLWIALYWYYICL